MNQTYNEYKLFSFSQTVYPVSIPSVSLMSSTFLIWERGIRWICLREAGGRVWPGGLLKVPITLCRFLAIWLQKKIIRMKTIKDQILKNYTNHINLHVIHLTVIPELLCDKKQSYHVTNSYMYVICVAEILMYIWEEPKSQENRPRDKIYAKGPRGVKELRSTLRRNSIEGPRNLQQKAFSSGRRIVALGSQSWVQKIIDFSLRSEFTMISDPVQGMEGKRVNNTETVLALMIFTYHWERG